MLEKRALMIGFMIGKLITENMPVEYWTPTILLWSKLVKMTPPNRDEMRETTEFMHLVSRILGTNHE